MKKVRDIILIRGIDNYLKGLNLKKYLITDQSLFELHKDYKTSVL